MRNAVTVALAVVALYGAILCTLVAFDNRGSSVGETGCAKVVHNYLHAAASAVGVTLTHEHLIACRQDGLESVARVEFDAHINAFGTTVHEVLALHLVKSPWTTADVHQVG